MKTMAITTKLKAASEGLTVQQLAELKKGRKASIMVGPDGNRFIALEGVSVNLLAYFSVTAHKKLVEERATVMMIPNGSKKAVSWIYRFMQAGERDIEGLETFESLNSDLLILLYQHCAFLQYGPLMERILQRLKGKFIESLPTIQEIELYQTAIPPLYQHVIDIIASEMVNPWTCDFTAYQDLAETNKTYGKDLDEAIKKLLTAGIKRGKRYYKRTKDPKVIWSMKYMDRVLGGKKSLQEPNLQIVTKSPLLNDTNVKPGQVAKLASTVRVIELGDFGGGLKTCDREVRKGEMTRTGMRI
ncbi:hypothetical protein GMOD_00001797 [Pyrenophora seminiperda CCB06]|uniref:Uncharacterized protein n=1 Tax=Pyrenophora seminiperda CCB06 TaxID=1302712 RepID=A0A3M7LW56_9PLEO|nr:hypothetical protein GMOD_00001797 [Pyrenophora seminiperda CCB06]